MFEKEAEEYIKEHTFFDEEYGVPSLDVGSKTIFKDGVKFGLKQHSYDYLVKTINLKKKYEKQIQIDAEQIRALQKQNGELTDRYRELEKENAELKKKYETMCNIAHNRGSFVICAMRENRIFEEQLTKTKELLEKVMKNTWSIDDSVVDEIKQFLKVSEVEK